MTRRGPPSAGRGADPGASGAGRDPLDMVRRAVSLYNAGRFWQAHEALESVWRPAAPPERPLWQGLIQAAAAMLHRERGNAHGLQVLGRAAIEKLKAAPPAGFPIETVQFMRGLTACVNGGGPVPPMALINGVAPSRTPPKTKDA